jgi:hypothetical protein
VKWRAQHSRKPLQADLATFQGSVDAIFQSKELEMDSARAGENMNEDIELETIVSARTAARDPPVPRLEGLSFCCTRGRSGATPEPVDAYPQRPRSPVADPAALRYETPNACTSSLVRAGTCSPCQLYLHELDNSQIRCCTES